MLKQLSTTGKTTFLSHLAILKSDLVWFSGVDFCQILSAYVINPYNEFGVISRFRSYFYIQILLAPSLKWIQQDMWCYSSSAAVEYSIIHYLASRQTFSFYRRRQYVKIWHLKCMARWAMRDTSVIYRDNKFKIFLSPEIRPDKRITW